MARVRMLTEADCPDETAFIDRIRGARRGDIINVYRLLLHAPRLAEVWFDLINGLRSHVDLTGRLRELLIIRVGLVTHTDYIVKTHVINIAESEGVTKDECAALADWESCTTLSAAERAALAYADAMTRDIKVDDVTFDALRGHFDERQIVEISVLVGTYNMHARVMTALDIDPMPEHLANP